MDGPSIHGGEHGHHHGPHSNHEPPSFQASHYSPSPSPNEGHQPVDFLFILGDADSISGGQDRQTANTVSAGAAFKPSALSFVGKDYSLLVDGLTTLSGAHGGHCAGDSTAGGVGKVVLSAATHQEGPTNQWQISSSLQNQPSAGTAPGSDTPSFFHGTTVTLSDHTQITFTDLSHFKPL
jgi:hypothetical protein